MKQYHFSQTEEANRKISAPGYYPFKYSLRVWKFIPHYPYKLHASRQIKKYLTP